MTYEDQKFLSSCGAAIFILLLLVNHDYFASIWWSGLLGFESALVGLVLLTCFRSVCPSVAFYVCGIGLFSSLFLSYSAFSLAIIARLMGKSWLWILVPLWIGAATYYFKKFLFLPDGRAQTNTSALSISGALGASASGLLIATFSKQTVMFAVTIALDLLLAFVMASAVLVWTRHLLELRRRQQVK